MSEYTSPALTEFKTHRELGSGRKVRFAAASIQGNRISNQDAFITPDDISLPTGPEQMAILLSQLTLPDTAGVDTRLDFTAEKVRGLTNRMQVLINTGKIHGLSLLADGNGKDGEISASVGTIVATDFIVTKLEALSQDEIDSLDSSAYQKIVSGSILRADQVVKQLQQQKELKMGATLLVVLHDGKNRAHYASVGDSRFYTRHRKSGLVTQITSDQSKVWQMLVKDRSVVGPHELLNHKERNKIFMDLGHKDLRSTQDMQFGSIEVNDDMQFILVCDGVWEDLPKHTADWLWAITGVDFGFADDIKNGDDPDMAAKKAFGKLFQLMNLKGLKPQASPAEVVRRLTGERAGQWSGDNVTAVVSETEPFTRGEFAYRGGVYECMFGKADDIGGELRELIWQIDSQGEGLIQGGLLSDGRLIFSADPDIVHEHIGQAARKLGVRVFSTFTYINIPESEEGRLLQIKAASKMTYDESRTVIEALLKPLITCWPEELLPATHLATAYNPEGTLFINTYSGMLDKVSQKKIFRQRGKNKLLPPVR